MQTCLGNVGNVVPTCHQILLSGPCQRMWHVVPGWRQPRCWLILFDIKKKYGRLRLNTVPPTHRPLLCQPNHDKHLAASCLAALGLVVSGLAVCCLGLLAMVDYCGFSLVLAGLVVWGQWAAICVRFCHSKFLCFLQRFRGSGFWGAGFGSFRLAAAGFRRHQVHHPDTWAYKCCQDSRTRHCQTQCGESHGFVHAVPDRCNNQPIRLDNIN